MSHMSVDALALEQWKGRHLRRTRFFYWYYYPALNICVLLAYRGEAYAP